MLSDERIAEMMRETWGAANIAPRHAETFARAIEAEARNAALEQAATAVETATYRKRWAKAAVNSHPDNVPPCEFAALIRAMKEPTP